MITEEQTGGYAIFLPDIHGVAGKEEHPAYSVVKKFAADLKPDRVIFGGDFLDLPYLSKFTQDTPALRENLRWSKDVEWAKRELDWWQSNMPLCTKWNFLEGNHERRVHDACLRHPWITAGVMSLAENLELNSRSIRFVAFDEVLTVGHISFIHGWFHNMHHTKKTLGKMGANVMYGHVHKYAVWSERVRITQDPHFAMSVGCLCDLNPDYLRGKPSDFLHGFGLVEFREGGEFQAHHIAIVNGVLTFGGRTWRA